jgi:hypothetical protein
VRLRRASAWLGLVVLLELIARAVVYGLAPQGGGQAAAMGNQMGGPGFVGVLLVAIGFGAALSTGLVWLASIGVGERWELSERRFEGARPHADVRLLLRRALVLTVVGWLSFAAVESVVHLHAGLGFHGLRCLVGPVHRNALPVIGGLSLVSSALLSAAALVLAWMRRTVARFVTPRVLAQGRCSADAPVSSVVPRRAPLLRGTPVRGPPALVA